MGRLDKVNQQIKREISLVLQKELADPRLTFVTITDVDASKDLKHAKVYFSVLGNSDQVEQAAHGLNGARGLIRKYVGNKICMRYTPELFFIHDQTLEKSAKLESMMKEIHDEYEKNHPDDTQE